MLDITEAAALHSVQLMARGERPDFDEVIAAGAVDRAATTAPPSCRVEGPAGFHATALWLRAAFADLRHRTTFVTHEGALLVVHTIMTGRHTGPLVLHDADGAVAAVWAPTGARFAVSQTHWLQVADGLVVEHGAASGDLGQGFRLGWVPSSPCRLAGSLVPHPRRTTDQGTRSPHCRPT